MGTLGKGEGPPEGKGSEEGTILWLPPCHQERYLDMWKVPEGSKETLGNTPEP